MGLLFEHIAWWHWLILAVILLILEVFSPAAVFMWMAFSAAVTGVVLLLIPDMSWQLQFLVFSGLSIVSIWAGRTWFKRNPIDTEQPLLNKRGEELIGRTFPVDKAIVDGVGRIRVGETTWKVMGDDCGVDTHVRVTGIDGTTLLVEKKYQ